MPRRSFRRAKSGNVSVITAISGVVLTGFAGLATDVGSVYLESRRLQGAADLAAIAAAQDPAHGSTIARTTLRDNNWPETVRVTVAAGAYTPDRAVARERRFVSGASSPNAARVSLSSTTPLFFGRMFAPNGEMTISRTATAAQTRWASFQLGSRLLAVQGGVANAALSALTGSTVNLSVMDYNALASADVDLLRYVSALRTRMDIEAATFDETLSRRVTASNAIAAVADALAPSDARASQAMARIAAAAAGGRSVDRLDRLIDLGPYRVSSEVDASLSGSTRFRLNALQLASAIAEIANGERQVRLDLASGVPGLADTKVWLAIGERPNNSPWLTITKDNDAIIRTAQARLYIESEVGLTGAAASLGRIRIPVLAEFASAQAKLSDIRCGVDPSTRSVTLSVAPSIGSLALGEIDVSGLNNFRSALRPAPAQLIRTALVRVDGDANVTLGGAQWTDVRFSGGDITSGVVKTVTTQDAFRATFSSLLRDTDLTVTAGGLGLGTSVLRSSVLSSLSSAGAPLDSVFNNLSALLGVRLGQADVRVNGVRCGGAALVA